MKKEFAPVKVTSIKGTLSLCLYLIYNALKDGEDIKSDLILTNSAWAIEEYTNITIDYLKTLVESEMNEVSAQFNKEAMLKDCLEMPISEVARKYGKTESSVYGLCNRNNIKFKKVNVTDKNELLNTIKSYNGAYSLEQIAKATHHSWQYIKDFCTDNNLSYREKGVC